MGNFGILLPPKLILRISMLLFLVVHDASCQYTDGSRRLKPCELESLLRDLTYPEEGYEMHAAALRNQLRNILERDPTDGAYQSVDEYGGYESSGPYEDKRSYRSLLRDGPVYGKRNLGSLARAGLLRTPSDYLKRSIATLAKNGQLPSNREPDEEESSLPEEWNEDKRNVASAFRSGYMMNGKRNIASLARKYELPGKRNIQSLLRTGMLPSIAPKRNMQSLARDNSLPHYAGLAGSENKRNIQTLVRDWNLPKQQAGGPSGNEKRNIQSLKNSQGHNDGSSGGRKKRELYYDDGTLDDSTPEILEPVYQSAPLDYEELLEAMSEAYPYYTPTGNHLEQKRFLGSLARTGMLNRYRGWHHKRSTWSFDDSYDENNEDDDVDDERDMDSDEQENDEDAERGYQSPQKRHIASLARSGWLPSFRPSRAAGRFSRSGRARSQIVELYLQPERLRQPTADVCRRCDTIGDGSGLRGAPSPYVGSISSSSSSWGSPGLQSTWGSAPPRVAALHWRRFRDSTPILRRRTARGTSGVLRRFQ
ncbi:neuropeptide-like precursor 1 isoform X2 [Malaya genurostris]|uniref:neuropeptide-like precursor 1 isoform X2 n=1 Tax=Malaya genurostris TaxID=325434 RepID=UPI0026F3ADEB|nr:neuropeptide-like precursor 1 isoform X2 [Malaya genurostris]